jgi:hypothetical protein
MTPALWGVLIPAVAGCLGALAAWLKSHTTAKQLADHQADPMAHRGLEP